MSFNEEAQTVRGNGSSPDFDALAVNSVSNVQLIPNMGSWPATRYEGRNILFTTLQFNFVQCRQRVQKCPSWAFILLSPNEEPSTMAGSFEIQIKVNRKAAEAALSNQPL